MEKKFGIIISQKSYDFLLDPMATNAWNALLVGTKRWALFHPETPTELLRPQKHAIQGSATGYGTAAATAAGYSSEDAGVIDLEGETIVDDWEDVWGWFHEDLAEIGARVDAYFEERLQV